MNEKDTESKKEELGKYTQSEIFDIPSSLKKAMGQQMLIKNNYI